MKHLLLLLTCVSLHAGVLGTNGVYLITNAPVSVSLAWDVSLDPKVDSYFLYYGTNSQQYTSVIGPITLTTTTVSNLAFSTTYYFACTSHSTDGYESLFSSEVNYTTPSIPNPTILHKPVKLAVQSRSSTSMWADTDMFWSFDPTATNEFFRVKLVKQ